MTASDYLALARFTTHSITLAVVIWLFITDIKKAHSSSFYWLVYALYLVVGVGSVALARYYVYILEGWYTPAAHGDIVRLIGLFVYAALTCALMMLKNQKDALDYWQEMYIEQLKINELLKQAIKDLEGLKIE